MILIQLVGGPDDGLKMKIDKHRYEWLIPRATMLPIKWDNLDGTKVADMYVSVYRKVAGSNRYRYVETRKH